MYEKTLRCEEGVKLLHKNLKKSRLQNSSSLLKSYLKRQRHVIIQKSSECGLGNHNDYYWLISKSLQIKNIHK